jgi:hypothetical protein
MLVGTLIAIAGTVHIRRLEDPAERIWVTALVIMCIPYAASLIVAFLSTLKLGASRVIVPQIDVAPAQPVKVDAAA